MRETFEHRQPVSLKFALFLQAAGGAKSFVTLTK